MVKSFFMMTRSVCLLLGIFVCCTIPGFSQPGGAEGSNFRARRAFDRALEAYHRFDYELAMQETATAITRAPGFLNAHMLHAEVLYLTKRYHESAQAYGKLVEIAGDKIPLAHFYGGMAKLQTGNYQEAQNYLSHFLTLAPLSSSLADRAAAALATCGFAIDAMQNPVAFNPINLGTAINSEAAEYSPAITADGETIIFTRRSESSSATTFVGYEEAENFYVSYLVDGAWTAAVDLGPPINTSGNEGAQSLSVDGRQLFFTACNRPGGLGSCDIYYAVRNGDKWGTPVNMGSVINSSAWDSHPSIAVDGQSLYFASARAGGLGEMDVWISTLDEQGRWQAPVNLGPTINTSGREMSPFIHPDNQTLYFASDGHPGMGRLDLFVSRRDELGNWTIPQNLGYPINTHADEFSLVVDAAGINAFYASSREGGYGDLDLYTFQLHPDARPAPMAYMKGKVYDHASGIPLPARFELLDPATGQAYIESSSDETTGEFLVVVPTGKPVALHVSSQGYLFFSEHFFFQDTRSKADPYLEDIALHAMRPGESVVLRNVFFDTGSFSLDPASYAELQRLATLLSLNPEMQVLIGGHTDNVGQYEDNLLLSQKRAESVATFLMEAGIDPERLTHKGFADTNPVDTNNTPEGRANNRRTAFSIVNTSP